VRRPSISLYLDAYWAAARAARTFCLEMASRDELCGRYHLLEMAIVAGAGMAEVVVAEIVAEVGVLGEVEVVGPTPAVDSVEVPVGFAVPMAAERVVVELGVVVETPDSRAVEVAEVVEAADSNLVETIEVEVAWRLTGLIAGQRVLCDHCECASKYRGQSG
jgi:hypothetical protein